ncbi:unnamed protein product [Rotaria sp. Silwood2]|nr:unnamed protein product [Rotaria sp. Silwood2]CAF4768497.1 unnamed protein product [Rotaria sp. Silwood2]
MTITFSQISNFQLHLPTEKLNLIIHIRNALSCIGEYNISSINVESNLIETNDLNSVPFNESDLHEYNKEINSYANFREHLTKFKINLLTIALSSIKLQSLSLAQLTQTLASEKCYQLSFALYLMSTRISYKGAQIAVIQTFPCAMNILSEVSNIIIKLDLIINLGC